MLTPKQVSESLKVPTSTLRRWAARFEKYLSPRHGKNRTYTVEDLDTFARIQDYLKQGFNMDKIDALLPVVDDTQEPGSALIRVEDFARSLTTAHELITDLKLHMDKQDARIRKLEEYISLPWYKRIGRTPPID